MNKPVAGLGILEVTFVVFLILKLIPGTPVNLYWSWWWVTSPIWGPFALVVAVVLIWKLYILCMTVGRKDQYEK